MTCAADIPFEVLLFHIFPHTSIDVRRYFRVKPSKLVRDVGFDEVLTAKILSANDQNPCVYSNGHVGLCCTNPTARLDVIGDFSTLSPKSQIMSSPPPFMRLETYFFLLQMD